ncbi:ribonuclease H-like domain-containing protein [Tanacetum coccineum]
MSLNGYSDREYDAGDENNVTLISKLDVSHPLHLHPNDSVALTILPRCTCPAADDFKKHNQLMKLMQFLMGLNDHYIKIRSSILSREVLPDVISAYSIISSEESYRIASGSVSECFKIIGYPSDFGKKKAGQNFKGKNVSNNASSFGFFDEQLSTMISLIKENSINGKGMQASMADSGANQHITFTDKFLTNVIDISHLKIKVSHPKGTEAFITKIGNMPLTDYLTLFDVLVVPEYCVSLMYVHKVARDSKLIIAFDELKCYILNQDLKAGKVLGTGRQFGITLMEIKVENLRVLSVIMFVFLSKYTWHCRLGHPADQVLNVLRPNLLFENDKSDVMCKICQKAKQTREPFPLSDHVSTEIGELVHLDIWGPYKATSRDGFRYFLIIVDDFLRVV